MRHTIGTVMMMPGMRMLCMCRLVCAQNSEPPRSSIRWAL